VNVYMHLIDGKPAYFDPLDGQIVFADQGAYSTAAAKDRVYHPSLVFDPENIKNNCIQTAGGACRGQDLHVVESRLLPASPMARRS